MSKKASIQCVLIAGVIQNHRKNTSVMLLVNLVYMDKSLVSTGESLARKSTVVTIWVSKMPDSEYILAQRRRVYKAAKNAVIKKGNETFTARDLLPHVKKEMWSYYRWNITVQTVTGALNRLRKENFIEIVDLRFSKGINKRYPSSVYRVVGVLLEEE